MSPVSHFYIKSGKPNFCFQVKHKTENTWDKFNDSKSVNSHSVLKDMVKIKEEKTEKMVSAKVETRFGIVTREVYVSQTRIICYGIIHTKRTDGLFKEISINPLTRSSNTTKTVKRIPLEGEIKRIEINGKVYRIIRKRK